MFIIPTRRIIHKGIEPPHNPSKPRSCKRIEPSPVGAAELNNSDRTEHRDETWKNAKLGKLQLWKSSILEMIAFVKVHFGETTSLETYNFGKVQFWK